MTDIQMLNVFTSMLERTFPTTIDSIALTSFGGLQLTFESNVESVVNSWEAGLVEFLDGDCAGLSFVISESNMDSVFLTSPFFNLKPAAGDHVKIYGGPLSEVRVFDEDPETLKEAVESGVKYFSTCAIVSGSVAWRALGARTRRGAEASQRMYGFEVTLETKHITGIPTESDMYTQFVALPLLKEQVVFLIQAFRTDAQNRLSGDGNIEWTKGFIQRPGNEVMRVYLINFDVALN
jgi:hypothetical protein